MSIQPYRYFHNQFERSTFKRQKIIPPRYEKALRLMSRMGAKIVTDFQHVSDFTYISKFSL